MKSFLQQGYTLIEILVVLFIISIVTSIALLTISHNENKQLATFAQDFTQLFMLAEEQAIAQSTILGLAINHQSFQFVSYQLMQGEKNNYLPLQGLLGPHRLPHDIQVSLIANHQAVLLGAQPTHPQVMILANGEITPFTFYIGIPGKPAHYAIHGDVEGNITQQLL